MTARRQQLAAGHPQFIADHLEFGEDFFLSLHDLNER